MSAFQQVAPKELYEAPEKLIYRFISSKLVFYHDTNQSMILNSANLVIPDEAFPVSMKVLARYLSSDFMNWVYGKIFSTHKVLRSDIERLPIFADQLITMQNFDEQKLLQEIGIKREQNGSYRIKK
jgi:site-specific DNA-methyltransferase (adenine-specific)